MGVNSRSTTVAPDRRVESNDRDGREQAGRDRERLEGELRAE